MGRAASSTPSWLESRGKQAPACRVQGPMAALLRCLPLLLLAGSGSARAFSLSDHRALSERALALEIGAHPSLAACAAPLPRAAVREDLDLVTKWGRFSHYYNPEGSIALGWRQASDARVTALWAAVQVGGTEVNVINTHLGLRRRER